MKAMFIIELDADEWVRVMRTRLEMTQSTLAKRLGIARQTVNLYENGLLQIPQERLQAISRMLDEESAS